MNTAYFREILRTRTRALMALLALLLLTIGLVAVKNFYLAPTLASLQSEWFSKRKTAGTNLDRGTLFERGSADLTRWRAMIAPKKDLARIAEELFDIARSNSLSVNGITYKPQHLKSEKLLAYVIGITVDGRYAAVKSFIGDIGQMRDIVTIDDISLNNPKLTEEKVSLKVNLTAYLRLEGE